MPAAPTWPLQVGEVDTNPETASVSSLCKTYPVHPGRVLANEGYRPRSYVSGYQRTVRCAGDLLGRARRIYRRAGDVAVCLRLGENLTALFALRHPVRPGLKGNAQTPTTRRPAQPSSHRTPGHIKQRPLQREVIMRSNSNTTTITVLPLAHAPALTARDTILLIMAPVLPSRMARNELTILLSHSNSNEVRDFIDRLVFAEHAVETLVTQIEAHLTIFNRARELRDLPMVADMARDVSALFTKANAFGVILVGIADELMARIDSWSENIELATSAQIRRLRKQVALIGGKAEAVERDVRHERMPAFRRMPRGLFRRDEIVANNGRLLSDLALADAC